MVRCWALLGLVGLCALAYASADDQAEGKELTASEISSRCAADPSEELCQLIGALAREALAQEAEEGSNASIDKRKSPFMRFGKRKSPFMRFGKRSSEVPEKRKSPFMRFGKRKSPFMRFGKRKSPFMRFGKRGAEE